MATEAKNKELWSDFPIEAFEDKFQISSLGRVRNKATGKLIKLTTRNGYLQCTCNSKFTIATHRAVALAFIPTDDISLYVNHIDHDKLNNNCENLEWVSQKENIRQALLHGRVGLHNRKIVRIGKDGDDVIYDGITKAAKVHGVDRTTISAALRGKNPTAAGYKWKYLDTSSTDSYNLDEFVEISNYPNYMVSNKGQIYSKIFRRLLKPIKNENGYLYICLSNTEHKPSKRNWYVHQLVAQLFLEPIDGKDQVNHINRIKTDNRVENLEFVNASENMIHMHKTQSLVPKEVLKDTSGDGERPSVQE